MTKSDNISCTNTPEIAALLERIREKNLSESDLMFTERVVTLYLKLLAKIETKKTTIKQLRIFLFGKPKGDEAAAKQSDAQQPEPPPASTEPNPKRPGHGRKPA